MSKRVWRYVPLVFGFTLFAAVFSAAAILTSTQHPNQHNPEEQGHTGQPKQPSGATAVPPAETVEVLRGGEEKGPCNPGHENRNSDLCAQWKAADAARDSAMWSMWSVIIGMAGTIGLIWNLIYTRKAVDTADRAIDETKKLGEAQARAYISIVGIEVSFHPIAKIFTVGVRLKNSGNSPATKISTTVALDIDLILPPREHKKWEWKQACRFPDIGTGESGPFPVEFTQPVSDEIARMITGMKVELHIVGYDVFNKRFYGAAIGITDEVFDFRGTHKFAFVRMDAPNYEAKQKAGKVT